MSARDGCICCFVHKNFKPDQTNKPSVLSKLFARVGHLLTNSCVQLSVLLATLVFLAIGIWGTMSLTQVCTIGFPTRIKLFRMDICRSTSQNGFSRPIQKLPNGLKWRIVSTQNSESQDTLWSRKSTFLRSLRILICWWTDWQPRTFTTQLGTWRSTAKFSLGTPASGNFINDSTSFLFPAVFQGKSPYNNLSTLTVKNKNNLLRLRLDPWFSRWWVVRLVTLCWLCLTEFNLHNLIFN